MKTCRKILILTALVFCLLPSCSKDTDVVEVIDNFEGPEVKVSATINGLILDEGEHPIAGAKVKINEKKKVLKGACFYLLAIPADFFLC